MMVKNYQSIKIFQMEEECVTLKWGDIVRIHGVNQTQKETKGLIISKGFTDPNIYYQIYQDFSEVNFYRESLFQVLPRSNFDMHDQLLDQQISEEDKENLRNRAQGQVSGLESALLSKAGKDVNFSSEVVFRHVESKSYLQGMLKAADTGQGAFKIEITDQLSSFVVFQIKSHRSYDNEKDKIYFNDTLQIYHPASDTYMNFDEKEEPIPLDVQETLQEVPEDHACSVYINKRPSIKRPANIRIAIINENKSKCLWNFIQHCSYEEYNNKEKIKSHDIVYFKHTKKNEESLVSTTISPPLSSYLKESPQGSLSYDCFWELIPKEVNEFGPEKCSNFWARSIVTGKLLEFKNFTVEIKQSGEEEEGQSEVTGYDNHGLINLIYTHQSDDGNEEQLKLDRGVYLQIDDELPVIESEYESKFKKIDFVSVDILPKDIFMICKVEEELMLDAQYVLSAHEPLVKFVEKISSGLLHQQSPGFEFPAFFFSLREDSLKNIITILRLLAGRIYGTDYDNIAASGNTPNQNVQKILVETGITHILIEIIHNLYEPFKFIEANNQPSADRSIRLCIEKIFELTYRLLEKIAAGNEDNRIYLSRCVDLFLEHSNGANKNYIQECLVGILQNNPKSIKATIDESKIEGLIECFLEEARKAESDPKEQLTTKYLRLFSTFIKCEGGVIKDNQNIILSKFFRNPNNEYNFRIKNEYRNENNVDDDNDPFKIKSREAHVSLGKGRFVTLPEFFALHPNKWNYFLNYIDLIADVCSMRNNAAIEAVSSIISLQSVAVILSDSEVARLSQQIRRLNAESEVVLYPIENVHTPFVRVAHHVFVNNEKFQPIKRIRKISSWYRNEDREILVEDINKTKRVFEGEKEEEEERHLQSILDYIKVYIKGCTQDVRDLDMLETVLKLLKETIVLGLWRSIKLFREIAPMLVTKIAKIQSDVFFSQQEVGPGQPKGIVDIVNSNKQKLKLSRPEISKSIDCKIIATEIFRYMNELEIDIRLRYTMNFFKGLYDTSEDFNAYDYPLEDDEKQESEEPWVQRNNRAREEYMKMDGKALFGDITKIAGDVDVLLKQNLWFNKLQELTPFSQTNDPEEKKNRFMFQSDLALPEERDEDFNNLVLALFELPVYQNYKLLNSSLNMLRTMFEQRKDLLDSFNRILICGKGNMQEVYITLKFMRAKFKMLTNSNILRYQGDSDKNFSFEIKKPYDYLVKDREKREGIIEDLFFLSRTLKEGTSLKNIESLMFVDEDAFIPNQIYSFIDEREKNNELFQSLNIAEEIYAPLIEYIIIVGDTSPLPDIHRKLLLSIYQYLTMLCFNNLEAKQILMQYIPNILPHLQKRVGAASFLYEVTRNNKLLVSNEEMVHLIIEKALESCHTLDLNYAFGNIFSDGANSSNDYEKSRILFSLRGVLLYNDQGIKENQQFLMNRLQDVRHNSLIFRGRQKTIDKISNFNLTPEETYIAYHFELFSLLVESGNLINIGKLENIHPHKYCLECLKNTNRWQIKRALRAYINRLFYVNKDKDIFLFEEFIRSEFDILNQELGDLIELYKSRLLTDDLKIKNGIRFIYAQSEVFLFIIECLITLHEMFLKPEFLKILRRELGKEDRKTDTTRPLHEKIIRLFKYLGCLKNIYCNIKFIDKFIMEVKRLMMGELLQLQIRYLEKKSEPEEGSGAMMDVSVEAGMSVDASEKKNYTYDHSKSFFRNLNEMIKFLNAKEKLEKLKDKFQKQKNELNIPENEMKTRYLETIFSVANQKLRVYFIPKAPKKTVHYDPHLQTANSRIFKVLAKPDFNENDENIKLNEMLTSVKKLIQDSPIFDKFKDDEFVFLVHKVLKLDETSTKLYAHEWEERREKSRPVITLEEIIRKTFHLVMESPSRVQDREKIFIIKVVRYYLTEAVEEKQSYKLPVDKWDADYCGENFEFANRQKIIQECGGSDFIISILKENLSARVELLNEVLLLGISYLFGGNPDCQNSILASLKKDSENSMLLSLRGLIKYIGDFLINVRRIKQNEKVRNFNPNIVDTYDYFSMEDKMIQKYFGQTKPDKFEIQTELNYEKALCRIFRFMQLFAENNNRQMKVFLSQQTNEDDSKKTNSINFIDEACLLLKKLFKLMNHKLVMLPGSLLGFIGEITQVPILTNQISFIKSTFFEDISYMASFFDSPASKVQRKFNLVAEDEDDPLNALSEMYQQSVQLALSNFEGNDDIIIKEFLNKCQPKFLWLVTRDQLWTLIKEKYSEKAFVAKDDALSDVELMNATLAKMTVKDFQQIIHEERKKENFEGPIISIIEVFIILKKVADYEHRKFSEGYADKENPNAELIADSKKAADFRRQYIEHGTDKCETFGRLMEYLDELVYQIEIFCENGETEKRQYIYFPNHPIFSYLAADTKDRIMVEVKRDTSRDKLISLLEFREEVYDEIRSNYEKDHNYSITLFNKSIPISITSEYYTHVRVLARNCSYLICLLMFYTIYVDHDMDSKSSEFTFRRIYEKWIVRILCALQLSLSIFFCFLWYNMRGSLAVAKYLKQLRAEGEPEQVEEEEEEKPEGGLELVKWTANKGWKKICKAANWLLEHFYATYIYQNMLFPIWALFKIENEFLSISLFMVTAFMGNFYGVEWYTVHLFDFFVGIPMLANVFKAIVDNIKVLGTMSALAAVFVLVFNVLSLSTYVPVIYEQELPEESCTRIVECVLTVYTSGAIGDDMEQFAFWRFFFDTIYVVFMELLFQNLVGGIMIDGYSALIAKDDERDTDKKGKCYICSMTKANIEKEGTTFKKHTEKHLLWNYIFYIYCLQGKDATDYTGIEYIIYNKIESEDVTWFPALGESDSSGEVEELMGRLRDKVDLMIEKEAEVFSKTSEIFEGANRGLKKKVEELEPKKE